MRNEPSLKKKAIRGVLWSSMDKIAVRVINFIVHIIIANELVEDDYGVMGMLLIFMALSNLLIDSGISQALVQKKDRDQTDLSTAFFLNIFIAFGCYALLFVIAPAIASFYETPLLTPILRVYSMGLIFNSLCTVQRARLLIDLDFRTLAKVNVVISSISGITGIGMALSEWGVWTLVYQPLIQQFLTSVLLWILGRWRPTMRFSKNSLKQLFGFGSKLLIAGSVATIIREIYSVMIGKIYRQGQLGYYANAVKITDTMSGAVNEIINSITFPILSSVQDDKERLVSIYSRMLSMTAFFIFPVMTCIAVLASPLINLLLPPRWLPIVPLIQWLCFARMFTPISSLNMNILNAVGRSDLFLKVDLSKIPIMLITLTITLPIGVKAVVIGNFIWTFISYFINAYLPGRYFGFGIKAQFKLFYKILISTAIMAAATLVVIAFIDSQILKLAVGIVTACVFYFLAARCLRIAEVDEIKTIITRIISR